VAVFGLVATLVDDPGARAAVRMRLARDPRISLGPLRGARLAFALDTGGGEEGWGEPAFLGELLAWPEVLHVDVAFAAPGEEREDPER
jgi:hypothetical protein